MGYKQAPGVTSGRSHVAWSCFLLWDFPANGSEGCQKSTHNWRLQKPYRVSQLMWGGSHNSAGMCKHLSKYNNIHRRISLMRPFTCQVTMTWQWSHWQQFCFLLVCRYSRQVYNSIWSTYHLAPFVKSEGMASMSPPVPTPMYMLTMQFTCM